MTGQKVVTAKGSNLIGDADYEKRATMFGRELHRDNRTDRELLDEALKVAAGPMSLLPHWASRPK